jgi:hypothetical protein
MKLITMLLSTTLCVKTNITFPRKRWYTKWNPQLPTPRNRGARKRGENGQTPTRKSLCTWIPMTVTLTPFSGCFDTLWISWAIQSISSRAISLTGFRAFSVRKIPTKDIFCVTSCWNILKRSRLGTRMRQSMNYSHFWTCLERVTFSSTGRILENCLRIIRSTE